VSLVSLNIIVITNLLEVQTQESDKTLNSSTTDELETQNSTNILEMENPISTSKITLKNTGPNDTLDLDSGDYGVLMVVNQIVIMIISIIGNLVTLLAIPYVRKNYASEFSILQFNSVVLVLHLSLCDLLYALVGFPHLIQVYWTGSNIYEDNICYFLGVFRNLVAYADFNTIAVIACCVARQNLCRRCEENRSSHDEHDLIFGGKRVYLVCIGIWVTSFVVLLHPILGITERFGWTASAYGCDTINTTNTCSNVGPFYNHIINFCAVIIFYSAYLIKIARMRDKVFPSDVSKYNELSLTISTTLLILTICYLAFLVPVAVFETCNPAGVLAPSTSQRAVVASCYWWIYGVNVIIYWSTKRIRAAYRKCFKDVWTSIRKLKTDVHSSEDMSDNFWLPLRDMQVRRDQVRYI